MLALILGIFFVLHGFVHLLYAGQSRRLYQLRPDMTWPDGAWALNLISGKSARLLVSFALLLAALGFAMTGLGLLFSQGWWRPLTVGSAVFSSVIFICCWDGRLKALDQKGGVGVLIDLAILTVVLIYNDI